MASYKIESAPALMANSFNAVLLKVGFGERQSRNDVIVRDVARIMMDINMQAAEFLFINGPASLPVAITICGVCMDRFAVIAIFDPSMNAYIVCHAALGGGYDIGETFPAHYVTEVERPQSKDVLDLLEEMQKEWATAVEHLGLEGVSAVWAKSTSTDTWYGTYVWGGSARRFECKIRISDHQMSSYRKSKRFEDLDIVVGSDTVIHTRDTMLDILVSHARTIA